MAFMACWVGLDPELYPPDLDDRVGSSMNFPDRNWDFARASIPFAPGVGWRTRFIMALASEARRDERRGKAGRVK